MTNNELPYHQPIEIEIDLPETKTPEVENPKEKAVIAFYESDEEGPFCGEPHLIASDEKKENNAAKN